MPDEYDYDDDDDDEDLLGEDYLIGLDDDDDDDDDYDDIEGEEELVLGLEDLRDLNDLMGGDEIGIDWGKLARTALAPHTLLPKKLRRIVAPIDPMAIAQRALGKRRKRRRRTKRRRVRRAARTARKEIRQKVVKAATVIRADPPDKSREWVEGFPFTTVPAGATLDITARPQVKMFRGRRLVIDQAVAVNFLIADIRVGQKSQMVSNNPIPAAIFSEVSVGVNMKLDTVTVGMELVLRVTNTDAINPHDFSAGVIGIAVD